MAALFILGVGIGLFFGIIIGVVICPRLLFGPLSPARPYLEDLADAILATMELPE